MTTARRPLGSVSFMGTAERAAATADWGPRQCAARARVNRENSCRPACYLDRARGGCSGCNESPRLSGSPRGVRGSATRVGAPIGPTTSRAEPEMRATDAEISGGADGEERATPNLQLFERLFKLPSRRVRENHSRGSTWNRSVVISASSPSLPPLLFRSATQQEISWPRKHLNFANGANTHLQSCKIYAASGD